MILTPDNFWTNTTRDNKASTAGNWSLGHIPSDSETALFNATSTANCDWDIATLVYGISLATGYSGVVTQNAATDILIGAGGYTQAAGTWTGNDARTVTCAGDFTKSSGTVTADKLNLASTGANATLTSNSQINFISMTVAGRLTLASTTLVYRLTVSGSAELAIATGAILKAFCGASSPATSLFSNSGQITGVGTMQFTFSTASAADPTLTLGTINAPVQIYASVSIPANRALTLGANATLGSTLTVQSDHASRTMTLALAGKSLQCTTLTIGARGIISSNAPANLTASSIVLGASGTFTEANITFDKTKVTGQSITWSASGAANASAASSWNLARAPWHNDLVIFDATSVNNCSWDIDAATVTVGSISIAAGYTGTVTQAATADIGIGAGGFSMAGGTLTGNIGKSIYCSGNFMHTSGTVSNNSVRLYMTGTGKTIQTLTGLNTLSNTGDLTAADSFLVLINFNNSGTINNTGVIGTQNGLATWTNTGTINGAGTINFTASTLNKTIDFGAINCPVVITSQSGISSSRTFTLGANAVLGSTLTILSAHASYTITLDQAGKSLSATAITVSTRGVLTNSGAEADCVVTNAFTLSGASSVVSGSVKLNCGSYVQSDGTLTQVSDISIGSGGAAISGGTFTASNSKRVYCAGNFSQTAGSIGVDFCLDITGPATVSISGTYFYKLWVSGAVAFNSGATIRFGTNIASGASLSIAQTKTLLVDYTATHDYSNQGGITGLGTLQVQLFNSNKAISFGNVSCPIKVVSHSTSASVTLTTPVDSILGSTVTVQSAHASNTCTLDLAGRSLQANGITIGTRGVLLGGEGVIRNYGSFDSSAGTWTPETCQYIQMADGILKTAAAAPFYDLKIATGITATAGSDLAVSHELIKNGALTMGAYTLTQSAVTQEYFDGRIAFVGKWARALEPSEIMEIIRAFGGR